MFVNTQPENMMPEKKKKGNPDEYTRIFILGAKGATDSDIRIPFSKYGKVVDVHILKERADNKGAGICYVTFNKASEAALAIEEMNGRTLPNFPKPLKIVLSGTRRDGNSRDAHEDEKMLKIFIVVPKSYTEEDVKSSFHKFGDIEYVRIIKDRHTHQHKGLAYVKYFRAYHAALAVENCDAQYKAMYATNDKKSNYNDHSRGGSDYLYDSFVPTEPITANDTLRTYSHTGVNTLQAMVYSTATEQQVHCLFDLIPGLEYCRYDRMSGLANIRYQTCQCAAYAKDKLDGFEFPVGCRMGVQFDNTGRFDQNTMDSNMRSSMGERNLEGGASGHGVGGAMSNDIVTLIQTMEKATTALQKAGVPLIPPVIEGFSRDDVGSDGMLPVRYCSVRLPPLKPLVCRDSVVVERLFIVSSPDRFPEHILEDCFCRFGDMISAFFMIGKKCGFVKYAKAEPAHQAIMQLHGQKVCGNTLKVILADPPKLDEAGRPVKRGHSGDDRMYGGGGPGDKQQRVY